MAQIKLVPVLQLIVSPIGYCPPPGHYPLADSFPFNYFVADSVPHVKVKNKGLLRGCIQDPD
jgi:hypothetical protein